MRLDIVMPAHNEQARIDRTLLAYRAACPTAGIRFLVALDSCTDATPRIVARHARADPRVRAFSYPKLGKGGVIAATFERSDADLVGFVDADCATPPRELLRLAGAAGAADAAGDEGAARELLDRASELEERTPSYYGAAWVALGRVMLQTDWLGGC